MMNDWTGYATRCDVIDGQESNRQQPIFYWVVVKKWVAERPFGRDWKSSATCSNQWAFVHAKVWQNRSIPKVFHNQDGVHILVVEFRRGF